MGQLLEQGSRMALLLPGFVVFQGTILWAVERKMKKNTAWRWRENSFFAGGSRRAELKFLMPVWQARQSGQALVEIFEKLAGRKMPQKNIPQKIWVRRKPRNTGDW